jgi:hypothetical protein
VDGALHSVARHTVSDAVYAPGTSMYIVGKIDVTLLRLVELPAGLLVSAQM